MSLKLTSITDATIDIKTDGGVETVALTDLDSLAAGTQLRIQTSSPIDGYFYAVLLDHDDQRVTVLFPVADSLVPVTAQEPVVVDWITAPRAGELRLVVSPEPVSSSDWPTLGGRDPDARHTSGCTNDPSEDVSTDA